MSQEVIDIEATKVETTDEKKVNPLDNPIVNQAAKDFMSAMKSIKQLSTEVSLRGLRRSLVAAIEFPFSNSYPEFKAGSKEHQLFSIAVHAIGAGKIMQEALALSKEEMDQQVIEPIKNEILTKNEGEQNG